MSTSIDRIAALAAEMNDAEVAVLVWIAERLHAGRETYGPLDPHDGRSWREELAQELKDALVYLAIWEIE